MQSIRTSQPLRYILRFSVERSMLRCTFAYLPAIVSIVFVHGGKKKRHIPTQIARHTCMHSIAFPWNIFNIKLCYRLLAKWNSYWNFQQNSLPCSILQKLGAFFGAYECTWKAVGSLHLQHRSFIRTNKIRICITYSIDLTWLCQFQIKQKMCTVLCKYVQMCKVFPLYKIDIWLEGVYCVLLTKGFTSNAQPNRFQCNSSKYRIEVQSK